jgi:F-type H+-transporting ATPase subunit beta
VAENFSGVSGRYVPLPETLRGFREIIEGRFDGVAENHFLNAGSIDDVIKSAKEGQRTA